MTVPFFCHWYEGRVPPFIGVGVKVMLLPAQIVVVEAAIVTDGTSIGFTVMVIPVLVTVVGEAHPALDVKTTVIISPFEIVLVTYVLLVAPAIVVAFFFHW